MTDVPNVQCWTVEQVGTWLEEKGFREYVQKFGTDHKIDGSCLLLLTEDDLRLPPLQMTIMGDIKRLYSLIQSLQRCQRTLCEAAGANGYKTLRGNGCGDCESLAERRNKGGIAEERCSRTPHSSDTRHIEPEVGKALLSVMYALCVFFLTSLVMTVVHERVPDMKQYPPLPDIFLDNCPYIPWAFAASELVISVLAVIFFVMVVFHKHRFIVVRRYFSLLGTVFLLRCVTMLITSLSVPGIHLDCTPQRYPDMWKKLERAFVIWKGLGMSLQGVRTCGDYMFSGHTVVLTMLNMFITEYTPRRWYYLHTATWIMSLFGLFFVLAAHEHYSLDVFVAFYITMRLFQYYHTLADNRVMLTHDRIRTRVWFPLFSFFESNCNRAVPNFFEPPISFAWIKQQKMS